MTGNNVANGENVYLGADPQAFVAVPQDVIHLQGTNSTCSYCCCCCCRLTEILTVGFYFLFWSGCGSCESDGGLRGSPAVLPGAARGILFLLSTTTDMSLTTTTILGELWGVKGGLCEGPDFCNSRFVATSTTHVDTAVHSSDSFTTPVLNSGGTAKGTM